ncbi:MAG: MarR family transcriptional regulator [Chloroflexi bacterium]|nr:MarR family transcriptional regulator [Chloroflexota bacterium]
MTTETEIQIHDAQLLAQFSQMYRTAVDAFMDRLDMHRGQALLLCTVAKRDGMTQSEIAEQLSVQGATITNMLQRMPRRGLVLRRRDPDDNRLVRVYVTDEGRNKEHAIDLQLRTLEQTVLKGIGEQDRQVLRQLVWQMIDNMSGAS